MKENIAQQILKNELSFLEMENEKLDSLIKSPRVRDAESLVLRKIRYRNKKKINELKTTLPKPIDEIIF